MPFSNPKARAAFFEKLKAQGGGSKPNPFKTPASPSIPMYPSEATLAPAPTIKTIKTPKFGKLRKIMR